MKVNKERLLQIKELNVGQRLEQMEGKQMDEYVVALNDFAEDYSEVEYAARDAIEMRDSDLLLARMQELQEMLVKIGADDLAAECAGHIEEFSDGRLNKFSGYVSFLLTQTSTLSIDIQMALFKEEAEPPKEISLKTIDELLQGVGALQKPAQKTILAVDDDPQCLDVFKMALKDVPCKIIAVTTGGAAMNFLKTQEPALFVLDIDMPFMDGFELARKIRKKGCKAPIIFITGNSKKNVLVEAMQLGGSDFIIKPINPQNVVERISRFI